MSEETLEPIRFRSQSEIDQMLAKLEGEKKYLEQRAKDFEWRIAGLKYVLALSKEAVAELAHGKSSGYQENAADWLISRVNDSRMLG